MMNSARVHLEFGQMHISRQKHHKIIAIVYKCSDTKLKPESILSMVILKY